MLSFYILLAEDSRNEALDKIAKEKKYSRFGGVVNRVVLYEAQQQIRKADEDIARLKGMLKQAKASLLPRRHKSVNGVEECLAEGGEDTGEDCPLVKEIAKLVEYQAPGDDE